MTNSMLFITYPSSVLCALKQDRRKTPSLLFVYEIDEADKILAVANAGDLEFNDPRIYAFGEAVALVWEIEKATPALLETIQSGTPPREIIGASGPPASGAALVGGAVPGSGMARAGASARTQAKPPNGLVQPSQPKPTQ